MWSLQDGPNGHGALAEMVDDKPKWTLEFYEDANGKGPCRDWMENELGDLQHDALVEALKLVLAPLGPDVCRSEWGKNLGDGLYEFRVRHSAPEIAKMFGGAPPGLKEGERVLLRVFFHAYGQKIVLLLGGYDKGKKASDRKQQQEIDKARKRLTQFKIAEAKTRGGTEK